MLLLLRAVSLQARQNWLPDLTTHFLFQYMVAACLLALALFLLKSWRYGLLACGIGLISLAQIWSSTVVSHAVAGHRPVFTIMQFNTLFRNTDHAPLADWLRGNASRFDVIVLHEATPGLGHALDSLQSAYPYRLDETRDDASGMIVLSRQPFAHEKIRVQTPLFLSYVLHVTLTPRGFAQPVSIYAMHAMTPIWGKYQNVRDIELRALTDSVTHDHGQHVLAEGDWNISPYSPYYADIARQTGLREQRRDFLSLPTWPSWGLPWLMQIPIDHILADRSLGLTEQQTGPALGSDHLPLIDSFVETQARNQKPESGN